MNINVLINNKDVRFLAQESTYLLPQYLNVIIVLSCDKDLKLSQDVGSV